jgi:large subunit ribosomal protein L17
LVERCITIALHAMPALNEAKRLGTTAARNSEEWRKWRTGSRWQEWAKAMAPVVKARRKLVEMLGNKKAAKLCFDVVAPRFEDRPGGYTRIVRLADVRLGDAGERAIIEFVGVRDRGTKAAPAPKFEAEPAAS